MSATMADAIVDNLVVRVQQLQDKRRNPCCRSLTIVQQATRVIQRVDVVVLLLQDYVAEALGDENVNKLSRVILHDPPSGVRTMKQMLNFAAGLFQFTAGTRPVLTISPSSLYHSEDL